jgi:hypothetical protein
LAGSVARCGAQEAEVAATSPDAQWAVKVVALKEEPSIVVNRITLSVTGARSADDFPIRLPMNALHVVRKGTPAYEYFWSKDGKWLCIKVQHHFGEQLFLVRLDPKQVGEFEGTECHLKIPQTVEKAPTLCQVDGIRFSRDFVSYDVSRLPPKSDEVVESYSVKHEFRTGKETRGA